MPLTLTSDDGQQVLAYVRDISHMAGLATGYEENGVLLGGFQSIRIAHEFTGKAQEQS